MSLYLLPIRAAHPEGHSHTWCHEKVCLVSQHILKSVEEITEEGLLHKESWTEVAARFCEEEQEEHCRRPKETTSRGHVSV